MDAVCCRTNNISRTAKSCGPGAPRLALSWRDDLHDDGDNNVWSPGRSRISRKTIAQGRPVVPARTCGSAACFFSARGPWVRRAPGLPCALFFERGWIETKNSDAIAPREHAVTSLSTGMPCACGACRSTACARRRKINRRAQQDQHTDARAARSCQHRTSPQWLNDQATLAVGATLHLRCGHFRSILGPRSVKRRVL